MTAVVPVLLIGLLLTQAPAPVSGETIDQSQGGPRRAAFEDLTEGSRVAAFRATARYATADGGTLGARFVHEPTGMPVDVLRFDSVPQAMVWVQSPPVSDRGEPHTLEHLVLGKGGKGRLYSVGLDMSLGSNSAGTWRDKTLYHFHTAGGEDSFRQNLFRMLDTLLDPDFTDEEIRREVAHLNVVEDERTGRLSLAEKGTVYLEMTSSFEKPGQIIWSEIRRLVYGPEHPLGLESGGRPEAIWTMEPAHIRAFHRATYRPGPGMGLIVGLPPQIPLDRFLADLDEILGTILDGAGEGERNGDRPAPAPAMLPSQPTEKPVIRILPFPSGSASEPGAAVVAWPPRAEIPPSDLFRLRVLWYLLCGDEAAYLHRDLVDRETRKGPAGLTSAAGWIGTTPGHPAYIWLSGVNPALIDPDSLTVIRSVISDRLAWIASLSPASSELEALNERVRTYLIAERRRLLERIEAPPRFGYRGTGDFWYTQLREQEIEPGFEKDLLLDRHRETLLNDLDRGNLWRDLITRSGLLRDPIIAAARPDTNLPGELSRAKKEWLEAETAGLEKRYGLADEQEALRAYKDEFDAATARLAAAEREIDRPGFLPDPPLTLDAIIASSVESLSVGGSRRAGAAVPICLNRFDRITAVDAGIYFDLSRVGEGDLIYLPLLPLLITDLGCWEDEATWLDYEELTQRLQKEVLGIEARPSVFPRREGGRVELAVFGTGLGAEEGSAAIEWIGRLLSSASRIEPVALSRLRDLVDREIASLRQRMMGAEEGWATNPAGAYRYEHDRVYLSTRSIFTQLHHLNRLAWRLREPPAEETLVLLAERLEAVAERSGGRRQELREELDRLAEATDRGAPPETGLAQDVALYLRGELDGIPDGSLLVDFRHLARQVVDDLRLPPGVVLEELSELVRGLLQRGPSRLHLTANETNLSTLRPEMQRTVTELIDRAAASEAPAPPAPAGRAPRGVISANLCGRDPEMRRWLDETGRERAPYAALPLESSRNALFTNSIPLLAYGDAGREDLIDLLAAKVFGGGGAHGLFMKTWGAGLAYSNGIGANLRSGLVSYYAERCSDGVETLRFVSGILQQADSTLDGSFFLDYALANVFADYRGGSTYRDRGRAMASDWADAITPGRVRELRTRLLQLRKEWQRPGGPIDSEPVPGSDAILRRIGERLPEVLGPILVGYGAPADERAGVVDFMIGPESQIRSFEEYLHLYEPDVVLARVYPRDFWID